MFLSTDSGFFFISYHYLFILKVTCTMHELVSIYGSN
uniref:Uncharacterized protein n=1 Tax=Nelumbo nucifera TaxID=4432 RepID=A0A822ZE69_NELNU|nr:TPA_asm: hypothetical protein HUJ06_001417 [Nelumbo nucifera]